MILTSLLKRIKIEITRDSDARKVSLSYQSRLHETTNNDYILDIPIAFHHIQPNAL